MFRRLFIIFSLCVLVSVGVGQSKKYVYPHYNIPDFTIQRAVSAWMINWYLNGVRDTTTWVYVTQSVYFPKFYYDSLGNVKDTVEFKFSVDSVRGRGDKREILLRRTYKTSTDSLWYATKRDTGMAEMVNLGPTLDSTNQHSKWMKPTPYEGQASTWNGRPITIYPTDVWLMGFGDRTQLSLTFDKVIGDPTVSFGALQRAQLRLKYSQTFPDSVILLTH